MGKGNIKVALVGCGRISGHHCRSVFKVDGVDLVAVCDLDLKKATLYGDEFGVKAYSNYHTMLLENPEISVVSIATPSGMHYEHAIEILEKYRKHIIVEKPTFMKPSQVKGIYKKAAELNLEVFAVFQNRHNKAVVRVLNGLKNNELGFIRTLAVRVRWCRPQRYYDMAPWRGTFAMDGGCLTNQGIHHIDLMRQMGGEVKRVLSRHRTLGADIEVEDTATAMVEFESGAMGTLEITTAARPIDYEASLSVVCENGLAQLGGIAVNELQVYSPDPNACNTCSEDFAGNVYGNGHVKIYQQIVNCLRDGIAYPIDVRDTFRTIQLLNSFYLSDELKTWAVTADGSDSTRLGRIDQNLANLYRTSASID
ncbi:Gfo/Idh/MocA family oxidoreductase [Alphaproteobacteria bacterium]|nr:Gfo/Idh/MocA family oxidoreductase [Alphaproteobacteria bacterium]